MALTKALEPIAIACDPPLDFAAVLAYLAPRATRGVETITRDGGYARTLRVDDRAGWIGITASADGRRLTVACSDDLLPARSAVAARTRRLLDLDSDPRPIAAHLQRDPWLTALVARRPHLRLVCAVDGFELAVRAVLGQGVTVRGASVLADRLAELAGEPAPDNSLGLSRLPITAESLARIEPDRLRSIGLTGGRAACLRALGAATAAGELPELTSAEPAADPCGFVRRIMRLPGIGAWTAHYVAMRALAWGDAFPEADLGLRKAMGRLSSGDLRAAAERWRPWRAYAACHLWISGVPG